jgi:hypothetical protein
MTDDRNLDVLLSVPLADVTDDGFSMRVGNRIARREMWSERLVWGVPAFAAVALAPFVPVQEFTDTVMRLGPAVASSAAISLAAAALVLTISFEQRYRDWQASAL